MSSGNDTELCFRKKLLYIFVFSTTSAGYITKKQNAESSHDILLYPSSSDSAVLIFLAACRELGLDELLRHCDSVVEKLRYPEKEPCYQAMAGTALFTHTTFDMLQNHSRYRTQPAAGVLSERKHCCSQMPLS